MQAYATRGLPAPLRSGLQTALGLDAPVVDGVFQRGEVALVLIGVRLREPRHGPVEGVASAMRP